MTVKAKQKGNYSCLHVTEDTTFGEYRDFFISVGREGAYPLNSKTPYWLVFDGDTYINKFSDREFKEKYEVVE